MAEFRVQVTADTRQFGGALQGAVRNLNQNFLGGIRGGLLGRGGTIGQLTSLARFGVAGFGVHTLAGIIRDADKLSGISDETRQKLRQVNDEVARLKDGAKSAIAELVAFILKYNLATLIYRQFVPEKPATTQTSAEQGEEIKRLTERLEQKKESRDRRVKAADELKKAEMALADQIDQNYLERLSKEQLLQELIRRRTFLLEQAERSDASALQKAQLRLEAERIGGDIFQLQAQEPVSLPIVGELAEPGPSRPARPTADQFARLGLYVTPGTASFANTQIGLLRAANAKLDAIRSAVEHNTSAVQETF